MSEIRRNLATIAGRKRRRALPADPARTMARVREARRAFRRFRSSCLWSYRPDRKISTHDIPWVAEQLMKHGNREAWRIAAKLCR